MLPILTIHLRPVFAAALLGVSLTCGDDPTAPRDRLTGIWGAPEVGLVVGTTATNVFVSGCAEGRIYGAVNLDPEGRFDEPGEDTTTAGPSRLPYSARYVGLVEGDSMLLVVVIVDPDASGGVFTLGPFTLHRGDAIPVNSCQ